MDSQIRKAIIPIAGLGTRFLPLSLAVAKEFLPVVDKPVIQYIVEEMRQAGITHIVFVVGSKQKNVSQYFKKFPELAKLLLARKKEDLHQELMEFEAMFEGISFSFAVQSKPMGDGHALLQAAKQVNNQAVASSFGDDIIEGDESPFVQLATIYKTCNAPVLGLKQVPKDKVPAYGMVVAEKIANRLYKIKKIVEKPAPDQVVSQLVVTGKNILTPEVFTYLKKAKPSHRGEIILADVFDAMLADGKTLYGYELKGEWLECGDKLKWLQSFFYMALKDKRFGEQLKQFVKTIR